MTRKILAVVAGYMVFAVSAALLFIISGHPAHQNAPWDFKILTIAYGIFFSVLAGLILQLIAKQTTLKLNFILALVIFLLAAVSRFTSGGCHWTQYFAMFIFAPASVLGGYLYQRRRVTK